MRALTCTLALAAAVTLAGCGVSTDGADQQIKRAQPATVKTAAPARPVLAARPAGQAIVDGATRGSLTELAARRYRSGGGVTDVQVRNRGEKTAFADLCQGRIDMVDSARPISRAEYQACRRMGVTPVQFQVAADAVVLAVKAETDIGADCLTVAQVRDAYRAGSPVYDWAQLGYDRAPVKVTGPDPSNNAFGFFGQYVLGSPQPSIADLRSDYAAQPTDRETRRFVVGDAADRARAARLDSDRAQVKRLRDQLTQARASRQDALSELAEAGRQLDKGVRDQRPAAAQARDRARLTRSQRAAGKARSWVGGLQRELDSAQRRARTSADAARRYRALTGRVGYFRFSYYELYEDELRPLEIDLGAGGKRNCVFPSQQTVTSATYPLARQLLITTSTRGLKRPEVSDFLDGYLADAQQLATGQRLVPLPDQTVATERGWLAGRGTPKLVTYAPAGR